MDRKKIKKADGCSASERVSSHVRTDVAAREILGPLSSARQRSRINKIQVSVWLYPKYKRSLLLLKAQDPSRTTESLVQEALDDLFAKRSMASVPAPRKKAKGIAHGD
jgi:hypothetical protein